MADRSERVGWRGGGYGAGGGTGLGWGRWAPGGTGRGLTGEESDEGESDEGESGGGVVVVVDDDEVVTDDDTVRRGGVFGRVVERVADSGAEEVVGVDIVVERVIVGQVGMVYIVVAMVVDGGEMVEESIFPAEVVWLLVVVFD